MMKREGLQKELGVIEDTSLAKYNIVGQDSKDVKRGHRTGE